MINRTMIVSDDLTLILHADQSLDIHSIDQASRHYAGITITKVELPDLLTALELAAREMGISTVQAGHQ